MLELRWFLNRCELFSHLTPEQLGRLEARSQIGEFAKRVLVYLPSETADGCFLLAAGRIRIFSVTPEGKQAIASFIEPGEIFGELAIYDSSRRGEFAEAAEKATMIWLPVDVVRALAFDNPLFALEMARLIALRRRRIERRLRSLLFRSHRQRLIHLLLELAEQFGRQTPRGVQLAIRLSHQELASVIGSTRESVTLLLGELERDAWLAIARRRIELLAADRMAAEIEFCPIARGPADEPASLPVREFRLIV